VRLSLIPAFREGDALADYLLGLGELIAVPGIDKVAAGFNVGIEDLFCFGALPMSPAFAKVACAQREL
jgi:hypothetical protein